MCARCAELDHQVAFLTKMVVRLEDPPGIEAAAKLIEMMEATKAALHRTPKK